MFTEYFDNPVMTKIKNENNYSMYMCKTYCLTALSCRYIIVFTLINKVPINTQVHLDELKWVSFQTRTLESKIDLPSHGYIKELKGPLLEKIQRVKISPEASTYNCQNFPLIVTLLHTKQKTAEAYQDKGNIILALEGWETIITFKD